MGLVRIELIINKKDQLTHNNSLKIHSEFGNFYLAIIN